MGLELLLPVILFLITLIILYLLRAEDKRDRRLELMKQRIGQFSQMIDVARSEFKDTAQQVEEKINHKIEASNQLLSRIDEQLSDLQMRSDDLLKLQEVLNSYRDSLSRLGSSTAQVEERIAIVKQEYQKVLGVKALIDDFDQRIEIFHNALGTIVEQGTEAIQSQQLRIKELLDVSYAKLQEYESDVQEVEQQSQARVAVHAQQLQIQEDAFSATLSVELEKIAQLQADVEQVVSQNQKAFEELREQSLQDVQEQKQQYENFANESRVFLEQQQKTVFDLVDQSRQQISVSLSEFAKQSTCQMDEACNHSLVRIDDVFTTMITTFITVIQDLDIRLQQRSELNDKLKLEEKQSLSSYIKDLQNLRLEQERVLEQLQTRQKQQQELELVVSHLKEESTFMQQELASLQKQRQETENKSWVEYVGQGDEEEISLDDEEEKTT
ncbi:MAG: hypothetical protein EOM15_07550 [Spirochaetia bacterium]|nr:hypothetical protein [Spirochaetia bacterium]